MSDQIFYYVVQDNEVVGRHFTNISDAMSHLKLYGRKEDNFFSLSDCCSSKKSSTSEVHNRAIIPIQLRRALHPDSLQTLCNTSQIDYCYWKDEQTLCAMKRAAEREHQMLMPQFDEIDFDQRPSKRFRRDVRALCQAYFENLEQELSRQHLSTDCRIVYKSLNQEKKKTTG